MGIVAYCPNGHRVKVKDELAGRKGVCPQCQSRFRVPRADAGARQVATSFPLARVVSLDAALAATLPRAVPITPDGVAAAGGVPEKRPVTLQDALPPPAAIEPPGGEAIVPAVQAARPRDREAAGVLHPTLAERAELTWSVAMPGGQPSAPMAAEAVQAFLSAGGLTGEELVWREDWADWVSIRLVFPEWLPASGRSV